MPAGWRIRNRPAGGRFVIARRGRAGPAAGKKQARPGPGRPAAGSISDGCDLFCNKNFESVCEFSASPTQIVSSCTGFHVPDSLVVS